jgi:hypothetical protein
MTRSTRSAFQESGNEEQSSRQGVSEARSSGADAAIQQRCSPVESLAGPAATTNLRSAFQTGGKQEQSCRRGERTSRSSAADATSPQRCHPLEILASPGSTLREEHPRVAFGLQSGESTEAWI